jgi:tetratricopeptide (TPR) repeat protein
MIDPVFRYDTWARIKAAFSVVASNVIKLIWIAACIILVAFVLQDLSKDLVIIEPISVPRVLADNGYTPEVAGRRLRDALDEYALEAGSVMKGPTISPRDELPNIVVPKIDISLDTILSSIRTILHYRDRLDVSGELVFRDNLAWPRLRVDGREAYTSPIGFEVEKFDELLVAAAPAVMEQIRPYLVASTIYVSDKKKAIEKADEIIAAFPASDVNVQWAYVLKGLYVLEGQLFSQQDYAEAEDFLRTAIRLNNANAMAHYNYGRLLRKEGRSEDAIAEFRRVIKIDPTLWFVHDSLGFALAEQDKLDDAIVEEKRAIKIDPKLPFAYNKLGIALGRQGKLDDAIAEFRHAIEVDPKYVFPRLNLVTALNEQGKLDDTIAEYKRAIEIDPNRAVAHDNLGIALEEQGKLDDAIAEYERAIEIDPNDAMAHNSLGDALKEQGKLDDAIAEHKRAFAIDPEAVSEDIF